MKTLPIIGDVRVPWLSILIPLLVAPCSALATPRHPGDQVGLFWLEVTNPNATSVRFDFKVANMTNMLSPNVAADLTVSTRAFTYRPSVTIPSTKPELDTDSVVPESLGGVFSWSQIVSAGTYDATVMSYTSVDPQHVADLIAELNRDIDTRDNLFSEFSGEAKDAMWAIGKLISPVPLDWESLLTKLLEIWLPGSDATVTLIDLGVTFQMMQTTLQSLQTLQPVMDHLADEAESQAMDVWLPYNTAVLYGSVPENPDPGIAAYLDIGPKGPVPTGNTTGIFTVPDEFATALVVAGLGALAIGGKSMGRCVRRRNTKRRGPGPSALRA